MTDPERRDQVGHALRRVREVAAAHGVPGVVLTAPGPVAWATAGMNAPIDRTAAADLVWLAVGEHAAGMVTTEVEAPRVAAELDPAGLGLELVAVPWWDGDAMVTAAAAVVGAAPERLGADGHPGFGTDLAVPLTAARLALTDAEQRRLLALGRDAAAAVEQALRGWRPGETDLAVAGRIAGAVEATGADAPVLLVGGDDRLARWRHPVAVGAPLHRTVMAVLVARRAGLHVALTRYAAVAEPDGELAAGLVTARALHREVLAACRPGATVGAVMTALAGGYAAHGHAGAWRQHYQGGPIGYAQREFELAPVQQDSPWWPHPLPAGCAVAWNPSVPGGGKDEDTYLLTGTGPVLVTGTGDWPQAADPDLPDGGPPRPAVLVLDRDG